jgi:hypothetical protein
MELGKLWTVGVSKLKISADVNNNNNNNNICLATLFLAKSNTFTFDCSVNLLV